jgi:phosphate transport system protein
MIDARPHFRADLHDLQTRAVDAIGLVLAALDRTIEALEHHDVELAQIVIDEHRLIDTSYTDVHHGVISLLTLQAPVASDLRLVAALLHIVRYAQRMGDQCVSVATLIALSGHEPPVSGEILDRVLTIGHLARAEVTQCKRAFIQRNVAMAEDLIDRDRDVNHLNREIFRLAADAGEDADTREWAMTMTLTARAFERVGDNAIAIGEQTAYLVTGNYYNFSSTPPPTTT